MPPPVTHRPSIVFSLSSLEIEGDGVIFLSVHFVIYFIDVTWRGSQGKVSERVEQSSRVVELTGRRGVRRVSSSNSPSSPPETEQFWARRESRPWVTRDVITQQQLRWKEQNITEEWERNEVEAFFSSSNLGVGGRTGQEQGKNGTRTGQGSQGSLVMESRHRWMFLHMESVCHPTSLHSSSFLSAFLIQFIKFTTSICKCDQHTLHDSTWKISKVVERRQESQHLKWCLVFSSFLIEKSRSLSSSWCYLRSRWENIFCPDNEAHFHFHFSLCFHSVFFASSRLSHLISPKS